jgi:Phosphatidylinositol-glycan biosynthesis class S protein
MVLYLSSSRVQERQHRNVLASLLHPVSDEFVFLQPETKEVASIRILLDRAAVLDWKGVLGAASAWQNGNNVHEINQDLFCISNVEITVEFTDLSGYFVIDTTVKEEGESQQQQQAVLLPIERVRDSVLIGDTKHGASNKYKHNAILYVPSSPSMVLVDERNPSAIQSSNLALLGNVPFYLVNDRDDGDNPSIASAINEMVSYMVAKECFGMSMLLLPEDTPLDVAHVGDPDNCEAIPALYECLYYHRLLSTQLASCDQRVTILRNVLLQMPTSVPITAKVADRFQRILELLAQARSHAESGLYERAVRVLDVAGACLSELETDPDLVLPTDFPLEQYAAIFAPILFPLFLPLFITLIKEYRRYRKLIKNEKSQ